MPIEWAEPPPSRSTYGAGRQRDPELDETFKALWENSPEWARVETKSPRKNLSQRWVAAAKTRGYVANVRERSFKDDETGQMVYDIYVRVTGKLPRKNKEKPQT